MEHKLEVRQMFDETFKRKVIEDTVNIHECCLFADTMRRIKN
jgi:hypothetical protein